MTVFTLFVLFTIDVIAQLNTDKLQLINAVFQDADENCNLDLTKYSKETIQTSLDVCKKGMAWLKIECDANYDDVPLCRENMPAIKTYLTQYNFDDRDIQYFHDNYEQNRLATQLDTNTMTIIQEQRTTKFVQNALEFLKDMRTSK